MRSSRFILVAGVRTAGSTVQAISPGDPSIAKSSTLGRNTAPRRPHKILRSEASCAAVSAISDQRTAAVTRIRNWRRRSRRSGAAAGVALGHACSCLLAHHVQRFIDAGTHRIVHTRQRQIRIVLFEQSSGGRFERDNAELQPMVGRYQQPGLLRTRPIAFFDNDRIDRPTIALWTSASESMPESCYRPGLPCGRVLDDRGRIRK